MVSLSRNRMRALEPAECAKYLHDNQYTVGRIAFNRPPVELLPVNYLVHHGDVVIQTHDGLIHQAAEDELEATFEIDQVAKAMYGGRQSGWSVVVHGQLSLVTDPATLSYLKLGHLEPAAGGFKPGFALLRADAITGREIN